MKLLVIGDIHLQHLKAEKICKAYPSHKKIFVGDYFDDFNDSALDNSNAAIWLKNSLQQPDRVHLMGNHDFHYWQWHAEGRSKLYCSGFSWAKFDAINNILSSEDWDKLKYFHSERGWWFSHAGITEQWFSHPVHGLTEDVIEYTLKKNIEDAKAGIFPQAIWSADFFRGGENRKGGIVWNDWRNLDLIPKVKQVVGHTPLREITTKIDYSLSMPGAINVNVDCQLREVLEINEKGEIDILNTSDIFS